MQDLHSEMYDRAGRTFYRGIVCENTIFVQRVPAGLFDHLDNIHVHYLYTII